MTTPSAKGLAVSNIAWPADPESRDEALRILLDGGATGVEVAPSLLFPDPAAASPDEITRARSAFEAKGLPVVAMQALLFNRPNLKVFGSLEEQSALLGHLSAMARVASLLGARVLVFGSPKNRLKASLSAEQADEAAAPFFRELGRRAGDLGVVFGIEANPPGYGGDWLTTFDEAADFVDRVASPGIALHGDAGGMIMSGQVPPSTTRSLAHHHASEPNLDPLTNRAEQEAIARWLAGSGHTGWISIEMRKPEANWQQALRLAIQNARASYASCLGNRVP